MHDRDTLVVSGIDENEFIKKMGGTISNSEKSEFSAPFTSNKSPSPNHTGTVVSSFWFKNHTGTTGRTGETAGVVSGRTGTTAKVSPSINSRDTITFEQS